MSTAISTSRAIYSTVLGLSIACNAGAVFLMQVALRDIPPFLAAAAAHSVAASAAGIWLWRHNGFAAHAADESPVPQHTPWLAILTGTSFGAIGTIFLLQTLQHYGAASTATLANMTLIWLVFGAVLNHRERLTQRSLVGIIAIALGSAAVCLREQAPAWAALYCMIPATLATAAKQLCLTRASSRSLPRTMFLSQACMAGWAILFTIGQAWWFSGADAGSSLSALQHLLLTLPATALPWYALIAAGLCGNFLGMSLLYFSYTRLGVIRAAPFDALRPVVVVVFAWVFGQSLFGTWQWAGLGLVLLGSVLITARPRAISPLFSKIRIYNSHQR